MVNDSRGYELKIGDAVAFNHNCGFKKREMFIGTVVSFDKYVTVELSNGIKVNKQCLSLFKLYKGE